MGTKVTTSVINENDRVIFSFPPLRLFWILWLYLFHFWDEFFHPRNRCISWTTFLSQNCVVNLGMKWLFGYGKMRRFTLVPSLNDENPVLGCGQGYSKHQPMWLYVLLKNNGLLWFWCAESSNQSILAFGWVEVLHNGVSLYFSDDFSVVRKLLGEYFLVCGCIWNIETEWFTTILMCWI